MRVPPLSAGTRYFIRPVPRVILFSKGKKPKHAYNIALLAERLQKAPDSLVNKTVDIEGLVVRDLKALNCTLMLCLKGFPCCTCCSQPLMLRDAWGQQGFVFGGLYKGRYVGCAGTECSQICAPLVPNKRYRLRVTIKKLDIWSATKLFRLRDVSLASCVLPPVVTRASQGCVTSFVEQKVQVSASNNNQVLSIRNRWQKPVFAASRTAAL